MVMDIKLVKEDLSKWDCGGAYRECNVVIHIDNTLPLIKQRQNLIYEILSQYLDPNENQHDLMVELSHTIALHIDELGE